MASRWIPVVRLVAAAGMAFSASAAAQPTVIWDQTFDGSHQEQWIAAPASGWHTNNGELVLRVACTQGITCHQLVCGTKRHPVNPKDYRLDSDVIEKVSRETRHPASWSFWAQGSGRAKVQILWFSSKKDARRYLEANPYDSHFLPTLHAPPVIASPGPGHQAPAAPPQYNLLWERTLDARTPLLYEVGPHRTWNAHSGILVLRAAGGPHARGFAWRIGSHGHEQHLGLGDHLLASDVLEPRATNPFEVLLGGAGSAQPFHFAGVGEGPVRVQVLWFHERGLAESHCHQNPFYLPGHEPSPPPRHEPAPLPPDPFVDPRTAHGYVTVRFFGTLRDASTHAALAGVDVFAQLPHAPHTILGGIRTDHQGSYSFTIQVPAQTPIILRIPERRTESQPRAFSSQHESCEWSASIR